MQKRHRDLLKMLTPVAEAAGVTLGTLETGGKHMRLPCTRPDGSTFCMTLSVSPSDKRTAMNVVKNFRALVNKNV
jgi:hypothetical protein